MKVLTKKKLQVESRVLRAPSKTHHLHLAKMSQLKRHVAKEAASCDDLVPNPKYTSWWWQGAWDLFASQKMDVTLSQELVAFPAACQSQVFLPVTGGTQGSRRWEQALSPLSSQVDMYRWQGRQWLVNMSKQDTLWWELQLHHQELAFLPRTRPKKRMLWNIQAGATLATCNSTLLLI